MTVECILYCDPELIVVDSRRLQLFSEHETHVPPPPPPKEDRDCDRVGKSDYPAHFPAGELHTTSEAAMTPRELSGAMFNDSGIMAWSAAEIQLKRTTGEQLPDSQHDPPLSGISHTGTISSFVVHWLEIRNLTINRRSQPSEHENLVHPTGCDAANRSAIVNRNQTLLVLNPSICQRQTKCM